MPDAPGYVVDEAVVPPAQEGDTASVRLTIGPEHGCRLLEQRVIRFAPGRSEPRAPARGQEVLFVVAGRGTIAIGGREHALEPDTGVYVASGETYEVDNEGPEELLVVSVSAPADQGPGSDGHRRVTVRYADQPPLPASENREFRFLVNQDAGCPDITQFVGVIPPSKAPLHSHTYDEVVYVIEGEGTLHIGDLHRPISAGTCIHLPPLVEHCLENSGRVNMRVLGVFHPSGDPASRAYAANQ